MQLAIVAAVAASLAQISELNPCVLVRCAAGTTCHVTDGTAACLKNCETTCGTVVPHGWSGYDDGSNACNKCGCSNGAMVCTKIGCPEAPCPGDVCSKATTCGGITGASCNSKSHVCIDDPADDCDPAEGGADCIGCCVFDDCLLTACKKGYECKLNSLGQAECVAEVPIACCRAIPTCSEGFSQVKTCTEKEFFAGVCVSVTLCCSTITCRDDTYAL